MTVEIGKECEFARDRLSDILYLARKTQPVDDDWRGYADAVLKMISDQADLARTALIALSIRDNS